MSLFLLHRNRLDIAKTDLTTEELTEEEKLAVYNVKMKYGFLLNGYNVKFYFWEILIFYRKISLIMVVVFFSVVSQEC